MRTAPFGGVKRKPRCCAIVCAVAPMYREKMREAYFFCNMTFCSLEVNRFVALAAEQALVKGWRRVPYAA